MWREVQLSHFFLMSSRSNPNPKAFHCLSLKSLRHGEFGSSIQRFNWRYIWISFENRTSWEQFKWLENVFKLKRKFLTWRSWNGLWKWVRGFYSPESICRAVGGDAGEGEGVPVNTLAFGQACVHSIPQTLCSFHVTIELDVGVRDSEVEQCPQVFTTSKRWSQD